MNPLAEWWTWLLLGVGFVSLWLLIRSHLAPHAESAPGRVPLDEVLWLSDEALANGLRILGGAGAGKTILAAYLVWYLFVYKRRASYVCDPTGSLFSFFATRLQEYCETHNLSAEEREALWNRVVVCELGGQSGYVVPTPQCRPRAGEALITVVNRVLSWTLAARPESKGAAIMGWPALEKILTAAILILAACRRELTELFDLLKNFKAPHWQACFQFALAHFPHETAEAVRFWTEEFSSWDTATRKQNLTILESFLRPYRYNPVWRAMFGGSTQGLDDEEIIREGKVVFILGDGIEGEELQQLCDWHLRRLVGYLDQRGSGRGADKPPFGLFIDEVSVLHTASEQGMEIFSHLLGQLVHRYRRQYGIHPLCVLHQSAAQLHPAIASHLAALGQIIGKPADFDSALALAPQVFDQQPIVKYWEPVLMHIPDRGIEEVHQRPVEYTRDEILHQQAEILLALDTFKFVCRLSPYREGGRRTELMQLDFAPYVGRFPDEEWVAEKRREWAAQSGRPLTQVLAEIEERLTRPVQPEDESATLAEVITLTDHDELASPDLTAVDAVSTGYVPGAAFRLRPTEEGESDG